ncbi:transposase [Paracoccus sp. 11-3]|uniref:Transposase n=1 Tax=Paracoccus amoyensis TaxID=2760093 RepID=A0A926GB46_9RHOB|nr:Mu transposase C-terminal domain-containing protein [Paracoccus amoyensis]MBC9246711.1 transposase [Paracoccus amoyensis]
MNEIAVINQQEFFTAAELAQIAQTRGLKTFPGTERGVQLLAEREGWNDFAARVSRPRPSLKAGGRPAMEYHFSILPAIMQQTIAGRTAKAALQKSFNIACSEERNQLVEAIRTSSLHPRARRVMEARAEVLTSIEGYAVSAGRARSWGIARFLEAQTAHHARQELERRRDAGQILTVDQVAMLAIPSLLTSGDGFHLSVETLKSANDRKSAPQIKRSTIYDWFKSRDAGGVVALAPSTTKAQQPVPDWFEGFLKFYSVPSKPEATAALRAYVETLTAGVKKPSLSQVKYILRERLNNIERNVGREGLLTLRSRLAYITRTTEDMWPTTIYSADGKTFDAEIADPVTKRPIRPEITTVIDVVTRKIVGISLARSENQRSVAEALRNSCCQNGIPAIFYVDRGPGYRNEAMDADVGGLMGRLGITKMHAAPYGSQAKGRIEIVNKTVWNPLARTLPTYIGEDMDKEAGQKVHKLTRNELKEFGESRLLPGWEEFVTMCDATVAAYNDRPHRSLPKFRDPDTGKARHMSPNECWAAHAANGFAPVSVDADEADDLFRPYEIRTALRAQVQWNGNQYFHQALEAYHQEKVMVGYDYHQADRVWVREFDLISGQPGRLICVARFGGNAERYVPLSYDQKAIETRARGRLRRVEDKRAAIEAERDGMLLIEHQAADVANFIDLAPVDPAPAPVPAELRQDAEIVQIAPVKPKRRMFASDEELAAWALNHPGELNPNQIAVLRRCMKDSTARKLFELSGIDLEALRTLLRAVA